VQRLDSEDASRSRSSHAPRGFDAPFVWLDVRPVCETSGYGRHLERSCVTRADRQVRVGVRVCADAL